MMLLKKLYMMSWLKKVNVIQTIDTSDLVKKLTLTQKLKKLKRKYQTMINLLPLINLKN